MTFTYQWKKCDSPTGSCFNLIGATHSTFTITSDLYGMTVRVQVTATNSSGAVAQNSESTKVISAIKPFLRVTPQITGTVMVGADAVADPRNVGRLAAADVHVLVAALRRRSATLPSCVADPAPRRPRTSRSWPTSATTLRVWITATNPAGSDQGVTNHTFPVVDKPHFAPTSSDSPLIVGTLEVGGVLTASIGTLHRRPADRDDAAVAALRRDGRRVQGHQGRDEAGLPPDEHRRRLDAAPRRHRDEPRTARPSRISDVTEPVIPRLPHFKGKTIIGTSKADYLIGTIHDDLIKGLGGNDTINGDGGYDTIYGGAGNDVINVAGPGTSHVYGGPGSDTIYAANGEKDYIDCGPGQDRAVIDPFDVVHNCEVVQVGSGSGSGN